LIASQFLSQAPPPQQTATGTIRGIVVREGTDEPISDVEIATMGQTEPAVGDTISGRVFDTAGKPVSDAMIQIVQMKTAPAVKVSGKVISTVMTGVTTERRGRGLSGAA
jgi:hypothetical protein